MAFANENLTNLSAELLTPQKASGTEATNQDDTIGVIVELEGAPLLDCNDANVLGAEKFIMTSEATSIRNGLVSAQADVKQAILNTINSDAKFKYSYTNVVNGFSALVKLKDVEKNQGISRC